MPDFVLGGRQIFDTYAPIHLSDAFLAWSEKYLADAEQRFAELTAIHDEGNHRAAGFGTVLRATQPSSTS